MILLDLETTGLTKPVIADIEKQPYIVEVAIIKIDADGKTQKIRHLVKPPVEIPAEVIKIHGITNEAVANAKPFGQLIPDLQKLFWREPAVYGHNVAFDMDMLYYELLRNGMHNRFPYPLSFVDTNMLAQEKTGQTHKLTDLYTVVTGKTHGTAHTALGDLEAVLEILKVWEII